MRNNKQLSSYKTLYAKALSLLARREHSYQELLTKLKRYSDNIVDISTVLNELAKLDYLSEKRYLSCYYASLQQKYGINKIRYLMQQKSADHELIATILKQREQDDVELALQLLNKKFPADAKPFTTLELAKQMRFLFNRGFASDVINHIFKQQR